MNLSNESIQSTVGNLLTIGSSAGTPTTGTLQNGVGQDVTSITLDELQVNRLVQTQATIAANGTTLSGAALLSAGVNLVTSADSSNIAVKLPDSQLGLIVNVVNTSSRDIEVFPFAATHSLVGLSAGASFTVPADNQLYQFVCVQNPVVGVWSVITPTSNNSVSKTVSINLVADGTHIGINGESWSSQELVEASSTTYYPASGNITILDAPSANSNYFDAPEFTNYNKVRIKNLVVKSNVLAGDLTSNASQLSSTLMGVTGTQLYNLFGYIRIASRVGASQFTINEYNGYRFLDTYSASVNNGFSTGAITHYMGTDGNLYQQINVSTPNASWRDTKDANGNRSIYYGPYIGYGSSTNSVPYSGYPSGFSFEAELIVDFEFSM